ncbi:MAG: hypothetical protein ACI38Q_01620 [Candidatus Bruticola sp.]
MNRLVGMIILLFFALALPGLADLEGMVVNVAQSGEITVNRGIADNVTPGTRWYIYRNGAPKAEVEAVLVDNYTTTVRVVSGSGVVVGDKITTKPFASAPKEKKQATAKNIESSIPKNQLDPRFKTTPRVKEETAESTEQSYRKALAASTKKASFAGGASQMRKASVNPAAVYNVFSGYTTSHGGGLLWQNALSVLPGEVGYNVGMKRINKNCCVDIEVTWWGDSLLDSYSDMVAFREGRTSMEQRLAMRNGLYSQKGADKFVVFHIKMKNTGKVNVQIEPFHWHAFILDSQGNRLKPERYDQILDKTLTPGQETEGNVYFSKFDSSGNNIADGKVTLVLEDILSERATMKF